MRIRLRLREDDSGIDLLPIADGDDSLPPALQEDLQPDAKIDADAALPKGNA